MNMQYIRTKLEEVLKKDGYRTQVEYASQHTSVLVVACRTMVARLNMSAHDAPDIASWAVDEERLDPVQRSDFAEMKELVRKTLDGMEIFG